MHRSIDANEGGNQEVKHLDVFVYNDKSKEKNIELNNKIIEVQENAGREFVEKKVISAKYFEELKKLALDYQMPNFRCEKTNLLITPETSYGEYVSSVEKLPKGPSEYIIQTQSGFDKGTNEGAGSIWYEGIPENWKSSDYKSSGTWKGHQLHNETYNVPDGEYTIKRKYDEPTSIYSSRENERMLKIKFLNGYRVFTAEVFDENKKEMNEAIKDTAKVYIYQAIMAEEKADEKEDYWITVEPKSILEDGSIKNESSIISFNKIDQNRFGIRSGLDVRPEGRKKLLNEMVPGQIKYIPRVTFSNDFKG